MNRAVHIATRPATQVMRLSRLGSLHQCRLSFMRQLTRRMARENWSFHCDRFDIDANGVGVALLRAHTGTRDYTLVAFSHDLPAEKRSDRVIAEAWDATFTLFDGRPTDADIARLRENVPLQEAGRITQNELTLSRANRSVRLWSYIIDALAKGTQPDPREIAKVGYLMRTTAVYGSGKFGASDREQIAARPEFTAPFQVEMLTVYLIRWFVRDLINAMAKASHEQAIPLDPQIAQSLGIGNSTGLGMAPFLINHPILLHKWIAAREEAISRVRLIEQANEGEIAALNRAFVGAKTLCATWASDHPIQQEKCAALRADLLKIEQYLHEHLMPNRPWDHMMIWAEHALSIEGQECLASLLLEPYGPLVDDLTTQMHTAPEFRPIDGAMLCEEVLDLAQQRFDWAFEVDWTSRAETSRAWYISEEKLEPRLGERYDEPITPYEQPLAPARDVAHMCMALKAYDPKARVGQFAQDYPEHRHMIRRLQSCSGHEYAEIHDNTIGADLLPIDMLRAKLSFFGATKFDPRSDRWLRITMFAGAPYPSDLHEENSDLWVYPSGAA